MRKVDPARVEALRAHAQARGLTCLGARRGVRARAGTLEPLGEFCLTVTCSPASIHPDMGALIGDSLPILLE